MMAGIKKKKKLTTRHQKLLPNLWRIDLGSRERLPIFTFLRNEIR